MSRRLRRCDICCIFDAAASVSFFVVQLGVVLIFQFMAAIGHIVEEVARWSASLLTLIYAVVITVAAIALPLLLAGGAIWAFIKILEIIPEEFEALKRTLSKQAAESATDATFLGIVALLAGLMFFMFTEDFLGKFSTIRIIAVSAALCTICKMLVMIPVRTSKIAGLIMMCVVVAGLSALLVERHHLVTSTGISFEGCVEAWKRAVDHESRTFTILALGTAGTLLVISVSYPFTLRGWRRMLKTE